MFTECLLVGQDMVGRPTVLAGVLFIARTGQFFAPWIEGKVFVIDQVLREVQTIIQSLDKRNIYIRIEVTEEIVTLVLVIYLSGQRRI